MPLIGFVFILYLFMYQSTHPQYVYNSALFRTLPYHPIPYRSVPVIEFRTVNLFSGMARLEAYTYKEMLVSLAPYLYIYIYLYIHMFTHIQVDRNK